MIFALLAERYGSLGASNPCGKPWFGVRVRSLHLPSLVGTTRVSVAFRSRRGRGTYHHLVASLCGCSILGSAAFLAGENLRFLCRISVATVACPGVCRQPCPAPGGSQRSCIAIYSPNPAHLLRAGSSFISSHHIALRCVSFCWVAVEVSP